MSRQCLLVNLLLLSLVGITPSAAADGPSSAADAPGETSRSASDLPTHMIYVEGLGFGMFYTLNYERRFTPEVSARVGLGYFSTNMFSGLISLGHSHSDDEGSLRPDTPSRMFILPVSAQYSASRSQNRKHHFELSLGGSLLIAKRANYPEDDGPSLGWKNGDEYLIDFDEGLSLGAVLGSQLGYRYEPPTGGTLFRFGMGPALFMSDIGVRFGTLLGLSIGYVFPPE